jgi:hypothetical protein
MMQLYFFLNIGDALQNWVRLYTSQHHSFTIMIAVPSSENEALLCLVRDLGTKRTPAGSLAQISIQYVSQQRHLVDIIYHVWRPLKRYLRQFPTMSFCMSGHGLLLKAIKQTRPANAEQVPRFNFSQRSRKMHEFQRYVPQFDGNVDRSVRPSSGAF